VSLTVAEIEELQADNQRCAEVAGLVYVLGDEVGIRRHRKGKSFRYLDVDASSLASTAVKKRIAELAIPPAWRKVWICPNEDGHILATGEDERGRKQYIYHPRWRALRDMLNFYRLIEFSHHLAEIRAYTDLQLRRRSYDRAQVMAAMIKIIDLCFIRIGNERYAEENNSFGLSTLTRKHVRVDGATVTLAFPAKSGKAWTVEVNDKAVARVVRELRKEKGTRRLFTVDGRRIRAGEVNTLLLTITGTHLTAKNFRTWGGTLAAFTYLRSQLESPRSPERVAIEAVDEAAEVLGNTRSVARAHYVHPHVLETYTEHTFADHLERAKPVRRKGLTKDERLLAAFLTELLDAELGQLRTESSPSS